MSTDVSGELGVRLLAERTRLGFRSASAFARALDVTPQAVSKIDAGAVPGGDLLARAAALGVDVQYVLLGRRSGAVVTNLLAQCEVALAGAYLKLRAQSSAPGIVRLHHVCTIYNRIVERMQPDEPVSELVEAECAAHVRALDDPTDPSALQAALFRSAPEVRQTAVSASHGSVASGRDTNFGTIIKPRGR